MEKCITNGCERPIKVKKDRYAPTTTAGGIAEEVQNVKQGIHL